MKRKIYPPSSESSELCSFSQNYHLYNVNFTVIQIFYFNLKAFDDSIEQSSPFPLEIFNFQTVTKVSKNSDRITLDLKLCSKLNKSFI